MTDDVLGIAIVTYRSELTLPLCLDSIRLHCPHARVVVVENSGDLESIEAATHARPGLQIAVVDPGGNVGYAKAVNLAATRLAEHGCTLLLILNPDVRLTADPLAFLPALTLGDVAAGVLVSSELPESQAGEMIATNAKRRVTWRSSVLQALCGARFTRVRGVVPGRTMPVPQVDGAYMLQSMSYFEQGGGLDESYELYFEDVEYCDRARTRGGVVISGVVAGVHIGGASATASGGRAFLVNRVSRARYLARRHGSMPKWLVGTPFVIERLVRGMTRQPEGRDVRKRALALVREELRNPGGVAVLSDQGPQVASPAGRD